MMIELARKTAIDEAREFYREVTGHECPPDFVDRCRHPGAVDPEEMLREDAMKIKHLKKYAS